MYRGERFNSVTHLAGLLFALAGTVVLIAKASGSGDVWKVTSVCLFGVTMVVLYGASTLFHSSRGAIKALWERLDHCAIYLFIAGSYMPFALVTLRGGWGWALFAVVWLFALLGIAKEWLPKQRHVPSVVLYLAMGWLLLAVLGPLVHRLPGAGLTWLLTGALLYTAGIPFYLLGNRLRHSHGIWHSFVVAGSASHFVTVLNFVV